MSDRGYPWVVLFLLVLIFGAKFYRCQKILGTLWSIFQLLKFDLIVIIISLTHNQVWLLVW